MPVEHSSPEAAVDEGLTVNPKQSRAHREGSDREPIRGACWAALFVALAAIAAGGDAVAFEQRSYEVLEQDGRFELRQYAPAIVAETVVNGDFEKVGSSAFRILVAYIGGENETRTSIAMTAPVTQQAESREIAMTAPVTQQRAQDGYRFSFVMPSDLTLETLPVPKDPRVVLREDAGRGFASVRYSGFWTRTNYELRLAELRSWMEERGIEASGEPVWARYDPPFMPWFLRTNEILIGVTE